ncbi:unnamed protein product [Lupinus luteus]|uniref:Factor of DNA methylation 1-5/IDN2 domain-containing protein n=1 Tax=Lupinus luteus TaxID=3873 RepID=A0AAV1VXE5_LUPLU
MEKQKADEYLLKLAEDQKKQIEKLNAKIIELEKQLDVKQEDLIEKEEALQHYEDLNDILIIKERQYFDELHGARSELLNFIKDKPRRGKFGVKRMGELDRTPFAEALKKKYNEEEAVKRASELSSLWEGYLKDPDWHPFKTILVEGQEKQIINDEDKRLNGLKSEIGEGAYKAVVTTLRERKEYNASGQHIVPELWNYEQGRRATLKEGVQFLVEHTTIVD